MNPAAKALAGERGEREFVEEEPIALPAAPAYGSSTHSAST